MAATLGIGIGALDSMINQSRRAGLGPPTKVKATTRQAMARPRPKGVTGFAVCFTLGASRACQQLRQR